MKALRTMMSLDDKGAYMARDHFAHAIRMALFTDGISYDELLTMIKKASKTMEPIEHRRKSFIYNTKAAIYHDTCTGKMFNRIMSIIGAESLEITITTGKGHSTSVATRFNVN